MGKAIVDATAMEIDGGAEELNRHGGALDVPTGASRAKGAGPKNLPIASGIVGLPENKVGDPFLVIFVSFVAPRGILLELVEMEMGEAAIRGEGADRKIDAPVGTAVS